MADTYKGKGMKLGQGGRFAKLKDTLSHEKGVKDPGALAASIGRKEWGNSVMAGLAKRAK